MSEQPPSDTVATALVRLPALLALAIALALCAPLTVTGNDRLLADADEAPLESPKQPPKQQPQSKPDSDPENESDIPVLDNRAMYAALAVESDCRTT